MKVGIIGCGNISDIYLTNLTQVFKNVSVYAVCDIDEAKAKEKQEKYSIPKVMTFEEMLDSSEIDLVLNLTTPKSHYALTKQALLKGKHVYVEKPLALKYEDGKELVALAEEKGLYLGCAPDTFLGAGLQTCIKHINEGRIGRVIGGNAVMMCHGHERWHPSPEFYYDIGGGPLFDMGPYYITALVRMLGRAESVFAFSSKAFETREISSEPKKGKKFPVLVDTHNVATIRFESGAIITLTTSFDVWKHSMPHIELYGTDGSMKVPDPNMFDGEILVSDIEDKEKYVTIPLETPYSENSRGLGISETALSIEEKRINNASGELGLHVLEIMDAIVKSSNEGRIITLESTPSNSVELDWNVEKGYFKTKK